jgi:hypothetical protein
MSEGEQTNGEDQGQPDDSESCLARQRKMVLLNEAGIVRL